MSAVKVVVRPEAKEDIRNFSSNRLKLEAMKYILRLEHAPKLGKGLEYHAGVGNLSDCRKIFIDHRRHRIIYRLIPDEQNPTEVDVIAVGPRELLEVYRAAVQRLDR